MLHSVTIQYRPLNTIAILSLYHLIRGHFLLLDCVEQLDMAAGSPPENVGLPSWIDRDLLERVLGEGGGGLLDYKLTKTGSKDEGYASDMYYITLHVSTGTVVSDMYYITLHVGTSTVAGDMYYITLHVSTGGDHTERETRRLVAKCLPSGGQHQDYVRRCSAFPRESGVYTDALPRMQRLLKGASSREQTSLAPRLYYSQQTPETVLLLEDLTTAGFKMVTPKHQGLNLAHCRLVLRQLASLHASSAMLMATDPTSMELYKEPLFLETEVDRQHWGGVFPGLARQLATEVLTWPEFGERSKEQLHRSEFRESNSCTGQSSGRETAAQVRAQGEEQLHRSEFRESNSLHRSEFRERSKEQLHRSEFRERSKEQLHRSEFRERDSCTGQSSGRGSSPQVRGRDKKACIRGHGDSRLVH
uniref:Uncharacterized protein n=1 Tax=Timema douglasi TaxID=61478 RepID=A0A7R8W281_TIMDO|nr:unnamed protein product [Timema douglasi]